MRTCIDKEMEANVMARGADMVHLMLACRANILSTPVKGCLALEARQLYWWYASVTPGLASKTGRSLGLIDPPT